MSKGGNMASVMNHQANEEEARSRRAQQRNQGSENFRIAGAQQLSLAMKQNANLDRAVIVTVIDPNVGTDAIVEAKNVGGGGGGGGSSKEGIFGLIEKCQAPVTKPPM
jgi:hypothetical protein